MSYFNNYRAVRNINSVSLFGLLSARCYDLKFVSGSKKVRREKGTAQND